MVGRAIALLSFVLVIVLTSAASLAVPGYDFGDVDEAAREAVASGEIPGVVVLVGQGDDVLFHQAWGWRSLIPEPDPMTPDTIFDIASLTKPMGTAIAIMALVERGDIRLDAPLGRYLREFRGTAFDGVTIERILGHTAGFPALPGNDTLVAGFPGAARALAQRALDYPPGTGFQYSDTGFIVLGEVVRRVSGDPLDRYLERILFRPLGLRDTSFRPPEAVRSRIAPTEFNPGGGLLRGRVHDPRARQLGGVAGHAGMFSTAADLSRICRMLLNGGELEGKRVLRAATVQRMWARLPETDGRRALGWDVSSSFSQPMAPFFPADSVGHTGFTGTAVWIDPASRTYMIVLTNRVHPSGGGAARVRELRLRVSAAVGAALFRPPPAPTPVTVTAGPASDGEERTGSVMAVPAPPPGRVRSGLDVMVEQGFAAFQGHTVGLITNHTGLDAQGRRGIDLFARAPGVRLGAIFSPEHGIGGDANTDVPHGRDAATGVPIWSLYGATRRPTPEMLRGLTVLVFDIQDVGVRYYTYLTTLVYVMEEAGRRGLPVVVLDRPNPITGQVVEGPLMEPDLKSFTGPHAIPVRTGLTIGEFGRLVAAERRLPVSLTVVPAAGWQRTRWYDETGLPWVNPSPNIRSVTQALLYSGVGLLEGTNLSVGRGTDTPFEVVGAPWVEPHTLARSLNARQLSGVRFQPVMFMPADDKHALTTCWGVRIVVADRDVIRPVTVAMALASELRTLHREQFRPENIQYLLVHRPTMWAFLRGEPLDRLMSWAELERGAFLTRRAAFLIYP